MSETIPVYDGPGTTTFGIFGTSPESPDGKRICYVRYLSVPDDEKWKKLGIESELWVCDHNLSQHNKLADLVVKPLHNGAHAFWIDDRRIAYSTRRNIYVVDADSGTQLLGPIQGGLATMRMMENCYFGNRVTMYMVLMNWMWIRGRCIW